MAYMKLVWKRRKYGLAYCKTGMPGRNRVRAGVKSREAGASEAVASAAAGVAAAPGETAPAAGVASGG